MNPNQMSSMFKRHAPICHGGQMSSRWARVFDLEEQDTEGVMQYFCSECGATVLHREVLRYSLALQASQQGQDPAQPTS